MKTVFSTLSIATAALAGPALADTADHGLDGAWHSMACEVRPQVGADGAIAEWWLTREITFAENRIEARFTTYAGPGCDVPVNVLGFAGQVDIIGDSAVADEAIAANLIIDEYVSITPMAQGFADFLNGSGACGEGAWALGEAKDVHETGCAILGVEPNTPTVEYEVLARIGDMVYFGARPVDGTFITSEDKRPRSLLVPLIAAN
ncbi:MAG: hypothetical protein HRU32_14230 [Rhodobacteraceae bacterium]|nr:hypothetical protein [Paracoccaceae bacterium]